MATATRSTYKMRQQATCDYGVTIFRALSEILARNLGTINASNRTHLLADWNAEAFETQKAYAEGMCWE